jgi:tetratricopeptide (TPR) repeat protein
VVVVDGRDDVRTTTSAAVVLGSFEVGEPDVHVRPLLKVQAGWELMRARAGAAALERFEAALAMSADLSRARLGAGLAAASLGKAGAAKAVEHLGRVVAGGADPAMLDPEAHRDALMYLGLAHAWLGQLVEAKQRLAEAAVRFPGDATVAYNLGCVEALAGDAEEAMYQLRQAFAADPALVDHARDDEDLVTLRSRPDFRDLLGPLQEGR